MVRLAPWPAAWIDPAPAIARRVLQLLGPDEPAAPAFPTEAVVVLTSGAGLTGPLRIALAGYGLAQISIEAMPLANA